MLVQFCSHFLILEASVCLSNVCVCVFMCLVSHDCAVWSHGKMKKSVYVHASRSGFDIQAFFLGLDVAPGKYAELKSTHVLQGMVGAICKHMNE